MSKRVWISRFLVCFFLLGYLMAACGGSQSGSGGSGTNAPSGSGIGPEGGTVAVSEQGTTLYGAKVYIPQGALDAEEVISVRSTPLPKALPAGYMAAGPCISLGPDGIIFRQPVKIYLPYADVNNDGIVDGKAVAEAKVGVLYYNEVAGRWESIPVQGTDAAGNLVVAQSGHFSTYLAVIDTDDSTPLDPGTPTTDLQSGDCLVGTGNLIDINGDRDSCYYFNLTVTRRQSGLFAVVDRFATYTQAGFPATVSPGGDSATFDAGSTFAKVLQSGDAGKWNWEAEFVQEHTYLMDYEVMNDALTGTDTTGTGIYCTIEAVDANMVRISWQIDMNEQLIYQVPQGGGGHRLVIRFRGSYK